MAYCVRLYLFVLGVMLAGRVFGKRTLFVMTVGVLPLLTFALVIQLTLQNYGPAAGIVAAAFGSKVGATLLLLLGAAEILAIYILTMHIFEGVRLFGRGGQKLLAPPPEQAEWRDSADPGQAFDSELEPDTADSTDSVPETAPETPLETPLETAAEPADFEPADVWAEKSTVKPAAQPGVLSQSAEGAEKEEEEDWQQFDSADNGISFPDIPAAPKLRVSGEYSDSAEPIEIDLDQMRVQRTTSEKADTEEWDDADWDASEQEYAEYDSYEEFEELETIDDPEEEDNNGSAMAAVDATAKTDANNEAGEESPGDANAPSTDSRDGAPAQNSVHISEQRPPRSAQVYEVVEVEPVSHAGPPPPKGTQLQLREKKPAKKFTYKNYTVPEDELLKEYPDRHYWVIDDETREWAEVLKHTLEEFKISAEVTGIQKGPVITMFEILPAPGVKLSKIVNLADNIALRLAASRVRIVAPIPGKHAVGIEVPNKKRALVSFKEMLQSEELKESDKKIPVILGKDITGETQIVDLTQTPHLLIAGATGSGKSVCVNSIICSVLYTRSPDEVRMVLIDPKIVELKLYNDIPHLLTPVITEAKRAFQALQYLLYEMERRYALLDSLGVRDIGAYNRKIKRKRLATQPLPYIVVIVDEFADLMATSGKELESTLARLAAMSRAVGIHLVLATQRPSIDVITGLIKANIPSRIAFMVANKFDSRIIIDSVGADKLLGQGDMLFTSAWNPHPTRIQGAYLSEEEVEHVADYVRTLGEPDYIDEEIFFEDDEEEWDGGDASAANDPLMNKALEVVASAGKASASYLQRRLKIGYNRAARLVEEMEQRGIVGPQNGSKPREILHIPDEYRPE